MNTPIRRLGVVTGLLFLSLLISTTWIQFFAADSIADGPSNSRELYAEYGRDRGPIVVSGTPVADSAPVDDDYQFLRTYANGALYAPATGFYSILVGSAGVEDTANDTLAGTSDQLFYRRIQDLLTGEPPRGGIVELTLDARVQQVAYDALGDQRGAVVAIEPSTGRILALVSKPSYDPNTLAAHDLASVQQAWDALNADPSRPLDNRAVAGQLYPPGSVFKIVTAAAAITDGLATPDSLLPGPAALDLPQTSTTLPNSDGQPCGPNDQTTLANAMRISCNTTFGSLGLDLGGDRLREQAQAFGFGADLDVGLRVTPSDVPEGMNPPQSAQAAIGQFDVRVTPLQVAMMSSAVANGGILMRPQLVDTVRAPDTTVISNYSPDELGRAVDADVAAQLGGMMELVVTEGTGSAAAIDGVRVAGKTGTAQTGNDDAPHAWFTAFAPVEEPRVAVAVVVENGGRLGNETSGGRVAAPIARDVIEAVLNP